jgi:uncharacterized lipoprotein YajG
MKSLLMALTVALLTACSSQYTPIIIDPAELNATQQWPSGTAVSLAVEDRRPAQYLAKIEGSSEKVTLVSGSNNLSNVVRQRLELAYQQQGLNLKMDQATKLTVELNSALVDVTKPGNFDYSMQSHVKITVRVEQPGANYAKQFRGTRTTVAPFKPDTATLESELNGLLTKVLNELVNDSETHDFIINKAAI